MKRAMKRQLNLLLNTKSQSNESITDVGSRSMSKRMDCHCSNLISMKEDDLEHKREKVVHTRIGQMKCPNEMAVKEEANGHSQQK